MTDLESRLQAGFEKQSALYGEALDLLDRSSNDAFDNSHWAYKLSDLLAQVAMVEATLSDDKRVWQEADRQGGPWLRQTHEDLSRRIRTLAERVDGAMAELTIRRNRLLPELDGFIRQRQMMRAYGMAPLAPGTPGERGWG